MHGKAPGTISLLVWSDNGRITNYEVIVRRDLTPLEGQIRRQFPNEPIAVAVNGKDVVLSGVVSAKHVIDRAQAAGRRLRRQAGEHRQHDAADREPDDQSGHAAGAVRGSQPQRDAGARRVEFLRRAERRRRLAWPQHHAAVSRADVRRRIAGSCSRDFLNLFLFNTEEQLGIAVRALKGKGLFQSLAEPNLITQDGKEASFLAGGEFPYPVVQGGGANQSVTIVFKEFGVRLRFTPTITGGGYVHLKVEPEVSTLDFANGVTLEGFRVPALCDPPHAKRKSSCATGRRSRFPVCSIAISTKRFAACPASATFRFSGISSAARPTRRTRPSSS